MTTKHEYKQPRHIYPTIAGHEVKTGDHIRGEYGSIVVGAYAAMEYVAGYPGESRGDTLYLIERPKPKSRFDLPMHTIISFPQFTPLIKDWDGWHHVNYAAANRWYTNEELDERHEGVDFTVLYTPEGWEN